MHPAACDFGNFETVNSIQDVNGLFQGPLKRNERDTFIARRQINFDWRILRIAKVTLRNSRR